MGMNGVSVLVYWKFISIVFNQISSDVWSPVLSFRGAEVITAFEEN